MVMGSAQRNALNKTALGTANALENWSRVLIDEMAKQGIDRHTKHTPIGEGRHRWMQQYSTDDDETVTFKRWQIRRILEGMAKVRGELLRFEKTTVPRKGV
ncbi:MAG TPA: hypothetical protein VGO49_19550 [Bradyrhizobium sp.]|jgi:hypothetical protein|nr:hypothetical protein [Bradyrhizobium sp.]